MLLVDEIIYDQTSFGEKDIESHPAELNKSAKGQGCYFIRSIKGLRS